MKIIDTADGSYNRSMAEIKAELDRLYIAFYKMNQRIDRPRNWSEAADASRILDEIAAINQRIYKEGEYA